MSDDGSNPWTDTPSTANRLVAAISRIATVMRGAAWQFANLNGLTPTQTDVLELLSARRQGLRLSVVADQLAITAATASDAVSTLVTKRLVEKLQAADDGRAITIRLTAKGRALAARAAHTLDFVEQAVKSLPKEVQTQTLMALLRLIGELQRTGEFPDLRVCVTCQYFEPMKHKNAHAPHHCHLVGAPLPAAMLRLDCPEHNLATTEIQLHNWSKLT